MKKISKMHRRVLVDKATKEGRENLVALLDATADRQINTFWDDAEKYYQSIGAILTQAIRDADTLAADFCNAPKSDDPQARMTKAALDIKVSALLEALRTDSVGFFQELDAIHERHKD